LAFNDYLKSLQPTSADQLYTVDGFICSVVKLV